MPFVTEEVWSYLPESRKQGRELLIGAPWPKAGATDPSAEASMGQIVETVRVIRNARAEYKVEPSRKIDAIVQAGAARDLLVEHAPTISHLAGLGNLRVEATLPERPGGALQLLAGDVEVFLPLVGMVDVEAERKRIAEELDGARQQLARLEQLLSNTGFVQRARPDVVERERSRLAETRERAQKLEEQLTALG